MNIPRIWKRVNGEAHTADGRRFPLTAWGWSSDSEEEAYDRARARLRRLIARVQSGEALSRGYYGDRPPREETVEEIGSPEGQVSAVVTRNAYGSLVLNTDRVLFVDVDIPRQTVGSLLWRLFGKADPADEVLERIRDRLRDRGSFRVYRTAAGSRVMGTDRLFRPKSPDTEALMASLGADRDFVHLCRVQDSFRARLTPKPWRCGSERMPVRFPRESNGDELRFIAWLDAY